MTPRVAVVGGGVAGAAVAYALRESPVEVTLFERAGRVGGRTATRRRGETVYDYGANYVTDDDERVADLLAEEFSNGLVDTEGPVWTFDADGEIGEGRGNGRKWTYEGGVETLAGRLVDRSDATVETDAEVIELRRRDEAWTVETADERTFEPFDGVVLTPPAPQTGDLLAAAGWSHERANALVEALRDVPYRTIWSLALHYPDELDRPYYALVNTDRDHEIGWLSREECKPGHVPDGESLLIVQMAPDWSAERYDADGAAVIEEALPIVADLLDDDRLADPEWTDHQRWGLALPDDGVDAELLDAVAEDGLWFAGDWVAGEGRSHAAIRTGLDAGDRIRERFE
ncbi:NAD(P)/FAD-dependent oxidoreductase [Natronoarchaeum rubrum]|uniref:NAD(P)/FAD-dependent oxidoreductase n=1 Tax=Natronoarchaeum rubrum TaxID=755311 RepID=UPI0021128810|nr:FAD-dependent oxidoreductase [Natronoarchaeum rubrum]